MLRLRKKCTPSRSVRAISPLHLSPFSHCGLRPQTSRINYENKQTLASAPPRLQRMMIRIQKYDIRIIYRPGKQIPVADTLSRKFLTSPDAPEEKFDKHVHSVMSDLPMSDQKLKELRTASRNDLQMNQLKKVILSGWPERRSECI